MSKCYNLVCPETKKAIWVGQRDYLYSTEEHMKRLAQWLHEHQDKAIFFVEDQSVLLVDVPDEGWTDRDDS
jgi:hypothetical protein